MEKVSSSKGTMASWNTSARRKRKKKYSPYSRSLWIVLFSSCRHLPTKSLQAIHSVGILLLFHVIHFSVFYSCYRCLHRLTRFIVDEFVWSNFQYVPSIYIYRESFVYCKEHIILTFPWAELCFRFSASSVQKGRFSSRIWLKA